MHLSGDEDGAGLMLLNILSGDDGGGEFGLEFVGVGLGHLDREVFCLDLPV